MVKEENIRFFERLRSKSGYVQICTVNAHLNKEYTDLLRRKGQASHDSWNKTRDINWKNEDIYFVGSVRPDKEGRASDDDIIAKNYMGFDFDLRKEWQGINQKSMEDFYAFLCEQLEKDPILKDFGAVVNSGNGLHLYYFFDDLEKYDKVLWTQKYEELSERIFSLTGFNVDPACKNIGRIMRLPGTFNQQKKYQNEEKKEVHIMESRNCKAEALRTFLLAENKQRVHATGFSAPSLNIKDGLINGLFIGDCYEGLKLWDAIKKIHCKAGLEILSGRPEVKYQEFTFKPNARGGWSILVNGKTCEAWIDKRGHIASSQSAMWITEWLRHPDYGLDDLAVKQTILKYFGEILPVSAGGVRPKEGLRALTSLDIERFMLNIFARKQKAYTWGVDGLDENFPLLRDRSLVFMVGAAGKGKTTWAYQLALQNALNGESVAFVSLEMLPEELIERSCMVRAGITKEIEQQGGYIHDEVFRKNLRVEFELLKKSGLKIIKSLDITKNTVNDIRELTEGCELVLIDGLTYVGAEKGIKDENERIQNVVLDFKNKMVNKGKTVILLHHFRKGKAGSLEEKTMEDMKGNNITEIAGNLIVTIGVEKRPLTKEEEAQKKEQKSAFVHPLRNYIEAFKDRRYNFLAKVIYSYIKGKIEFVCRLK